MDFLLKTENLTKRFPGVVANDSVSLAIRPGEIHCLLGENGAGKSTLAECLYGYYQPDSGHIYFRGQEVDLHSPRDAIDLGIGMVHQHFVLVSSMMALENIVVGMQTGGRLDLSQAEAKLQQMCSTYGIDLDLRAKIWHLSVGEQQWVEILKALYPGVDLLILDEPTAVLTPQEAEKLFVILQKMKADGLSIVFITHKLREVMEISDRVTVLRKGKLVDTVNTAEMTREQLAKMMVGREVVFRVQKEQVAAGEPQLEIQELRASNDRGLEALHGVNLTVHKYEIVAIAGVAGNGQRELYDVLVGARKAAGGKILFEGEDIINRSPKMILDKGIRFIPADRLHEGLVVDFSISENLILGLQRKQQYRQGIFQNQNSIDQFADQSIDNFEIATTSPDQPAKVLSGGNLQKVILARELSQQPRFLIANQPTRGLDVGAIEYVHQRLLEQRQNGVGILLFSEDLEEIFNLADRIAVIYKGSIMGIFEAANASLEEIGLLMAGIEKESDDQSLPVEG